jgi:hypothetical protein
MRFSKIALLLALFVQLGMITAVLGQTILYSESFENNNWGIFEEIVGGNACYGDSIGAVETSNEFAFVGAKSLRVWANKAQSNFSNHVLANHQLYNNGVEGTFRYSLRAYMPANNWHGQTGTEWSLQTTKGPQNLTYIAGIQYVRNPWVPDKWNIWHNGTWVTIPSNVFNLVLATDAWYLFDLDFDLIHNKYLSMHIAGNGVDTTLNLQQTFANAPNGYLIAGENRGFAPSTWLTLESENLWTGCSFVTDQKMYYDDVVLSTCPNRPVANAGSDFTNLSRRNGLPPCDGNERQPRLYVRLEQWL